MKKKQCGFWLDEDVVLWLDERALARRLDRADVVREILYKAFAKAKGAKRKAA